MAMKFELIPGVGLSDLHLGASSEAVAEWAQVHLLGNATELGAEVLEYETADLGLELEQIEELNGRVGLALIVGRSENATLYKKSWIGASRPEVIGEFGEPDSEEVLPETGFCMTFFTLSLGEYVWFRFRDGRVEEFAIGPKFTDDGRHALWPDA
jgi:hypothetical protein